MKWITRSNVKVDRVACPWLIRRFIDSQAEFVFLPAESTDFSAITDGPTFDATGAKFRHVGEKCTCEVMMDGYNLSDPALVRLGKIVRAADTKDTAAAPEGAGLKAIAEGMRSTCASDQERLEKQFPVYDALYAYCRELVEHC
ncbi:MAG: chromate resistance protein ChrB domain-containing protein [Phycisphaerae bacterium]